MLNAPTTPVFCTPIDNIQTTLAAAHAVSSGTLVVASVAGFGTPSPSAPLRLTCVRASDGGRVHFLATGLSGTTFTVTTTDGYSDITLAVGDSVGITAAAGDFLDLQSAVLELYAAIGSTDTQVNANTTALAGLGTASAHAATDFDAAGSAAATLSTVEASGYQTAGQVNAAIESATAAYVTSTALGTALAGYATTAALNTALGNYTTTATLAGELASKAQLGGPNVFVGQQTIAPVALTPGSSVAWNMATAPNATLAPTANFTLSNPTNLVAGGSGVLTVTQDSTGGRVVTWGSAYRFPGGSKFVLSTAAGAVDEIAWYSPDGTHVDCVGNQGFA